MLAALSPRLVERLYSRRAFPRVASALSALSRPFPFPVGELLLPCLVILAFVLLFVRTVRAARAAGSHSVRHRVAHLLFDVGVSAAWAASASAVVFMLVFGLNYERLPLAESLGYEQRPVTADELEPMAAEVVDGVNSNYDAAHAPGAVVPGEPEVARVLEESYGRLAAALPGLVPAGDYGPPKPAALSWALTRAGVSGFYFPLTGEANYNRLMPDFQRPFTMAHEMAHQRGFARESEANFVAFLVCTQSSHPFVRYSGYRNGLGLLTELRRVAPEKVPGLFKRLGPGYRSDSEAARRFWSQAGGRIASVSGSINDIYLKANRVRSGAANYSESTALLIGYYLKRNGRAAGSGAAPPGVMAPGGADDGVRGRPQAVKINTPRLRPFTAPRAAV
jgi:hypothetical protein